MALTPSKDGKVTVANLLLPISLIAFVVFIMLGFQTSQILIERKALHDAKAQQVKPLDDSKKIQAQLDALAMGTKKLAEQGDKDAKAIMDQLKQMGISVGAPEQAGQPAAMAPAAPAPVAPAPAPAPAPEANP
jgi:hypothetical protein